jgi:hypothetical protein
VNYDVTVLRPLGDPDADCDGSHPSRLEVRIRLVKTSAAPPPQEINEPVSPSGADRPGFMRFVDGPYKR